MSTKLSQKAVKKIHSAVDTLFDRAKARLLGRKWGGKSFAVKVAHDLSLPGLFEAAHRAEKGIPDHEHLDQLLETASNYVDSLRHRAKAQTVQRVKSFLKQAEKKGVETDVHTVLGGELADLYGDITSQFKRIVDTEAQHVRNVGVVDGIVRANASIGIEDPIVFFVVVRDQHLCDECKRVHLLENGVTPRVFKLSEVGYGYHQRGESTPKIGGLHPHCRCSMTTLLPGFGFDKAGMVEWKKQGHDEYERQRNAEGAPLKKSTPEGRQTLEDLRSTYERDGDSYVRQEMEPHGHGLPNSLVEAVNTAPITMNFPPHVADALIRNGGHFRNLFETGTGEGDTNLDSRKNYEENLLLSHELEPQHRPLYGALHVFHQHPKLMHDGGAASYGKIFVRLKPHVRERSTFTPEDSSDSSVYGHVFTDKHALAAVHAKKSIGSSYVWRSIMDHFTGERPGNTDASHDYTEAQIHGGVDMSKDVDSIHVVPPSMHRRVLGLDRIDQAVKLGKHFNLPVYHGKEQIHYPRGGPVDPSLDQIERELTGAPGASAPSTAPSHVALPGAAAGAGTHTSESPLPGTTPPASGTHPPHR